MPWAPELFSAPALQQLQEKLSLEVETVPFFEGLMMGELNALLGSFSGEPQLHHPLLGRIRGRRAFGRYVTETNAWLEQSNASIEDVERVAVGRHGFGEAIVHLDGEMGRLELPVAIVNDRQSDGRIDELRVYYSSRALTGGHAHRPPLLQPDPRLQTSAIAAEYERVLATGNVDGVVAAFEPDGYVREFAGARLIHSGHDGLRAYYERLFSNDGGIALANCALIDDTRACALEYNVVRRGKTDLPPEAGIAVYVRGQRGKLAAARIYDDVTGRSSRS